MRSSRPWRVGCREARVALHDPQEALVRSSAAEYLTFVAASGGGGVEAVYADENVGQNLLIVGMSLDDAYLRE